MTQIKELEKALLDQVGERLEEYGYQKRTRDQSFYKTISSGRLAFHLSFIKHKADFDVTADVAVRFDELEDLINEHRSHLSNVEKRNTFSLGVELGNISEGRQKRWTVASFEDVEPVAQSIMNAFVAIGLPYLEKYSNMETALEVLSGDDKESWLHSPFHDARAQRALGLAFLLGDRERFSQLAAAKTEFLKSRNDFGLTSFLQFRDALENRLERTAA